MFTTVKVWDPSVMTTGSALKIEGFADDLYFDGKGLYLINMVHYDELTVIDHYGKTYTIDLEWTHEETQAKAQKFLEAGEITEEDLKDFEGLKITMISQRSTEEEEQA